jgi:hypothetical protein
MATGGQTVTDGLSSETSSIATTIVPLSQVSSAGELNPQQPPQTDQDNGRSETRSEWAWKIDYAFLEAEDLILSYCGKKVGFARAESIKKSCDAVTRVLRDGFEHCDAERQGKIAKYRKNIVSICVELEEMSFNEETDLSHSPAAHSSPRHRGSPSCLPPYSPPPTALEFERRTVEFSLRLLNNSNLPDVETGISVDSEFLRELHDVRVPEVDRAIKECRDAVGKYATRHGCEKELVEHAQLQCERASKTTKLMLLDSLLQEVFI